MSNYKILPLYLLLTIYLVPLIGAIDFLISIGVLEGASQRSRSSNPFPYLIVLKEVFALFIFAHLFLVAIMNKSLTRIGLFILLFILLISLNFSFIGIVAGVRQSIGLVYIILGMTVIKIFFENKNESIFIEKFIKAIKIVLLIEFLMACLQIVLMPGYEGTTFLGSRAIGSFTNPNTLGVFSALALISMFIFKDFIKVNLLYHFVAIFTVLSAGSRTALILLVMGYIYYGFTLSNLKNKILFSLLWLIISLLIISNVNIIASKPDGIQILSSVRIDNLLSYINTASSFDLLFGHGWGENTSWHRFLYFDKANLPPLDSFVASMIYQKGLFGIFLIYAFFGVIFFLAGFKGVYLYIIFVLIGMQINILEFYPINFIIFSLIGILIGMENHKRKFRFNNN